MPPISSLATPQVFFDSLYSLITHYQQMPLVSPKFSITLGRAVPPPNQHEGKVRDHNGRLLHPSPRDHGYYWP